MKQCHGWWPGVWGTRDTAPSSPPLLCAVVSRVGEEIWAQKCWGPEISAAPENLDLLPSGAAGCSRVASSVSEAWDDP